MLVALQPGIPAAPAQAQLPFTLQDCLAARTEAARLHVCSIISGTEEQRARGAVEAARILRARSDYAAAADLLERRGSHHLLEAELGHVWFDQGDHAMADLHFETALDQGHAPDEPTRRRMVIAAHLHGEDLQYSRSDPAGAVGAYARALALDPGYAPALLGRGEALQKLGRHRDALLDLDRAIASGADWTGHLLRARARQALGDVAGAVADFRRVIEENPGHAGARRALAELAALPR
jgi:tetratricopeptide (TPR) repeat protein